MLCRALSLATVTLLIGYFAAIPAQAQNLEAGKSPSQIFAGTCAACHKSPRGLLKTVAAGSLAGFLRQHYTTSSDMASLLSSFLVSNGATDTRYVGSQPKPGKDAKLEPAGEPEQVDRHGRRLRPASRTQEAAKPGTQSEQAAKPDADGLGPQAEPGRQGRKRLARPGAPDTTKPAIDGQPAAQAEGERAPDGRKSAAKQKLTKRGQPGSEESPKESPKTNAAGEAPAKSEPVKDDKSNGETAKVEATKPGAAGIAAPKESGSAEAPVLRADPVPPVTPAPPASPGVSAAASSPTPETVGAPSAPAAQPAPPPAVTASMPPLPPVTPAGPPAPPISQ